MERAGLRSSQPGHPLPPALGLIRSPEAGKTWESVSELGTSDFHAISRSGDLLVAPLYGQSQILLSRDDGQVEHLAKVAARTDENG